MKAYYGSRISPNQTETNEGYLIAHNVPIARTGSYEYLGSEIGADTNDIVKVHRTPEEVFSPSAVASFEGKPVVNDHPPVGLSSENATDYSKGTVTNVKRGKGSDSDLLLADLIIHDQRLIDAIRNGKREVSAGYDCDYVPNGDGTYSHKNIVGNHVAVVEQGRAGHRVHIKDQRTVDDSRSTEEDEKVAKKYGISVKKDGHRTPPDGYPKDREQYGDPVNYKYPLDTREHVQAAVDYFQKKKDHADGDYSDEEWAAIGKRITEAANRVLHKGYEYKGGNIVDTKHTQDSKGGTRMKLKKALKKPLEASRILMAEGWRSFVSDAEPDEIAEAFDQVAEELRAEDEDAPETKEEPKGDTTKDDAEDQTRLKALEEQVAELKKLLEESKKTSEEKTAEETLDEELSKLNGEDDNEEESQTVDPENMTNDDPGPVAPEDERTRSGFAGDSAKRAALLAIKPVLASIPDEKTRRKVVDTAIASFKGRSGKNAYATIDSATRKTVQKKQAQQPQAPDHSDLGRQIREKYNAHYKTQA